MNEQRTMSKIRTIKLGDDDFPEVLRSIPGPPKQLYVLGDLAALLAMPRLAVVGSRHVSPYGRQITSRLVEEIAGQGVVIISGLAIGVDAIAHQAALAAHGQTIAVLPCGLDKLYPSTNARLGEEILKGGGALVSEYPDGTPPLRQHFIARNRLVSGLANGVLITEAAARSGTIHTAGFALDQGRTVMAVPGNITSPQSAGTNNLIKTGAVTVTDTSDILLAMGLNKSERQLSIIGDTAAEVTVLRLLSKGQSDGGELLRNSELSPVEFNQALTMLELAGKVRPLGAGHWGLS